MDTTVYKITSATCLKAHISVVFSMYSVDFVYKLSGNPALILKKCVLFLWKIDSNFILNFITSAWLFICSIGLEVVTPRVTQFYLTKFVFSFLTEWRNVKGKTRTSKETTWISSSISLFDALDKRYSTWTNHVSLYKFKLWTVSVFLINKLKFLSYKPLFALWFIHYIRHKIQYVNFTT